MIRLSDEIGAAHPALAGHFPGRPVVPGALLLARVAAAAERSFGTVRGVPAAKFLAPLRPGERFEVELEAAPAAVRFRVMRGATVIAAGTLQLARITTP